MDGELGGSAGGRPRPLPALAREAWEIQQVPFLLGLQQVLRGDSRALCIHSSKGLFLAIHGPGSISEIKELQDMDSQILG